LGRFEGKVVNGRRILADIFFYCHPWWYFKYCVLSGNDVSYISGFRSARNIVSKRVILAAKWKPFENK
jgi:hypothetical protein